jgi:hypothetical protein
MLRSAFLLVILVSALPAKAESRKVTITFLGGAKKVRIADLKVTIRAYTGDWGKDSKKTLTEGKTQKDGSVTFTLADGWYYVEVASDKELPYLNIPVGYKAYPGYYSRFIQVGKQQAFEFNLADACKLTLRAVDADTGKGIPGVSFSMESETGESGDIVTGDNLGADYKKQRQEVTDQDGWLVRYMGPWPGYSYFASPNPKGYEPADRKVVTIPTPLGKEKAEHTFKFKKK